MGRVKMWFVNKLMRHVCNGLTVEDFLEISTGKGANGKMVVTMKIGGEKIRDEAVQLLISEARTLQKLTVWNKVLAAMRSTATNDLVNRSKIVDDMVFAKAMLYTLGELEKTVRKISSI